MSTDLLWPKSFRQTTLLPRCSVSYPRGKYRWISTHAQTLDLFRVVESVSLRETCLIFPTTRRHHKHNSTKIPFPSHTLTCSIFWRVWTLNCIHIITLKYTGFISFMNTHDNSPSVSQRQLIDSWIWYISKIETINSMAISESGQTIYYEGNRDENTRGHDTHSEMIYPNDLLLCIRTP